MSQSIHIIGFWVRERDQMIEVREREGRETKVRNKVGAKQGRDVLR